MKQTAYNIFNPLNSVCFLLLFLIFKSNAQGGFKKKYFASNGFAATARNVIECPNKSLIIIGLNKDTVNNFIIDRLTLIGTDKDGNKLWEKKYGDDKFSYLDDFMGAAVVQDNNCFYHALSSQDTADNGVLIKFDYNGDTLWQKVYRKEGTERVYLMAMTKSVDNGFLLTGVIVDYGPGQGQPCVIIKTDKNGNELWRKKIVKASPNVQEGRSIVQDSATKKIVVTGYQYDNGPNTLGNMIVLDSLGNFIARRSFNNGGGSLTQVIQLRDKNFVTGGAYRAYGDQTFAKHQKYVVKFNISGSVIWQKVYDIISQHTAILAVHELPNEDLIMLGSLDTTQQHLLPFVLKAQIFRTDKNGNVKWQKYIGSAVDNSSCEYPLSLNPTKDGGFLVASSRPFHAAPSPYSIIKIDSTGCDTLESYCKSLEVGLTEQQGFSVAFELFPNPASSSVFIKTNTSGTQPLTAVLLDISGRTLQEFPFFEGNRLLEFDTTPLSPGVYFVSLRAGSVTIGSKKLLVER